MKILILIDSLDIGGAETHVEILSSELDSMGHEITVASSGGIISERLKKHGIKHIYLPKIQKTRKNAYYLSSISQFLALNRAILHAIANEKPDVVHAHTRLTAFFAKKICRARKIPLIFTAHAKFDMSFPKNVLSKWGDHTISVSEDIKKHLSEHGLEPSEITVIENGVKLPATAPKSPENFNKNTPKKKKIVFVSRLDSDCSLGAYALCNIADRLAEKYGNLKIIIVGGGEELQKIKEIAQKINNNYNRELISTVGRVENPFDLCGHFDSDTLFVGVSRAAIEAMAHGLPVILLGNEGYLGLLTKKNLDIAKETNFTCRGNGLRGLSVLEASLFEEICSYFDLPESDKARISEFSFSIVKNGYTAQNMAQKTVRIYEKAVKRGKKASKNGYAKHPKIAICGYYGHGNLGDEAILSVILKSVKKHSPSADIRVIGSKNPLKITRALISADLFIFGGGSLLQNSTSDGSLFYYLMVIAVANLTCKRKIMLSNGIGPIKDGIISRRFLLNTVAKSLKKFDFVSVRDTFSQNLLSEILPERDIHLLPDPAVSFIDNINCELFKLPRNEYIIYIPCAGGLKRGKISTESLINSLNTVQRSLKKPILVVVLNKNEDLSISKEVALGLPSAKIVCPTTPDELISVLMHSKFVISQRYHGTLFAILCQLPALAISDDPKMQALCTDLSIFPCKSTKLIRSSEGFIKTLNEIDKSYVKNTVNIDKIKAQAEYFDASIKKILNNFDNLS